MHNLKKKKIPFDENFQASKKETFLRRKNNVFPSPPFRAEISFDEVNFPRHGNTARGSPSAAGELGQPGSTAVS